MATLNQTNDGLKGLIAGRICVRARGGGLTYTTMGAVCVCESRPAAAATECSLLSLHLERCGGDLCAGGAGGIAGQ